MALLKDIDTSTTSNRLQGQPINAQTGTTYTLVLTDAGQLVSLTNAAAITLTVPTNASVAFITGTRIELIQGGAGTVTVAGAGGVTVNAPSGTLTISAQYGRAFLQKTGTNTWVFQDVGSGGGGGGVQNFIGSGTPGVNDDSGAGYSVDSIWFDTDFNQPYICSDATVAAAVWNPFSSDPAYFGQATNSAPGVNDDITQGWRVMNMWLDTTSSFLYVCVDNTTGAAVWTKVLT